MLEKLFSFAKNNEEVNTLKSEHLNKGVYPIIAGVGTPEDFYDEIGSPVQKIYEGTKNYTTLEDVDYYGNHESLTNKNYKNPSEYSYVISPINGKDKISRGYKNCTGVAVSGVDKETGKNISFLSHQDPDYFLLEKENTDMFFTDLKQQTQELKEKCVPGTIDAVMFGGNYFIEEGRNEFKENYKKSISSISAEIKNTLGFTPPVLTGPKVRNGSDDIYFDNENRRLYIVRPKVGDSSTESYLPKDIKKQEEKWQSVRW